MSDLVARLRQGKTDCDCTRCEAADEIERLTAENLELRAKLSLSEALRSGGATDSSSEELSK